MLRTYLGRKRSHGAALIRSALLLLCVLLLPMPAGDALATPARHEVDETNARSSKTLKAGSSRDKSGTVRRSRRHKNSRKVKLRRHAPPGRATTLRASLSQGGPNPLNLGIRASLLLTMLIIVL